MTPLRPSLLTVGFFLACAIPASAQFFPEIRADEPIGGTLSTTDPVNGDDAYSDGYIYRGRRGERLTITLRSEDFDAYVWFSRMTSNGVEDLQGNDDGGGGSDARLRVTLDRDGDYTIVASSYSAGETGAYRLAVTSDWGEPSAGAATQPTALALGVPATGTLARGDLVLDDDTYYDLYTIAGDPGQQVDVTLTSSDFDAYLSVGQIVDGELEEVDSDDDSAGSTDAFLRATIPHGGVLGIRANSLSAEETGTYTLVASAPGAGGGAVTPGSWVRGELRAGDGKLGDDSFFDDYVYQGRAGEQVTIDLVSDDFDAYLLFGRRNDGVFEPLVRDDDGGDGLNARVTLVLPRNGEYVIRANSLQSGATGSYRLQLRSSN